LINSITEGDFRDLVMLRALAGTEEVGRLMLLTVSQESTIDHRRVLAMSARQMGGSITRERLTWRLRELAAVTGLSVMTLRRAIASGELHARRVGRALLIGDATVHRFLGELYPGGERRRE
jgi:excisionase family DNA binding protein